MNINIDILIIGAGYSGLMMQKKLDSFDCTNNLIVERGYDNGYGDSEYVILLKEETPFAHEEVKVITKRMSSGSQKFYNEFVRKVYNSKTDIDLYYDEDAEDIGYKINNELLLKNSRCYGNIDITEIDVENKIAYGKVLHLKATVKIHYKKLVSTIPVHKFENLVGFNFLKKFGLFISYFPIGIVKKFSDALQKNMNIEYYSDPDIPFYRKQLYNNAIFYEYCLNRPLNQKFSAVIIPGKFTDLHEDIMGAFYDYFSNRDIYFAGRFATWDSKFQLNEIWSPSNSLSNMFITHLYGEV